MEPVDSAARLEMPRGSGRLLIRHLRASPHLQRHGFLAILALIVLGVMLGVALSRAAKPVELGSLAQARGFLATAASAAPVAPVLYGSPPGYALVLAGLAAIDGGTAAGLDCIAATPETCGRRAWPFVVGVQVLIAIATLLLVLALAWRLSGQAPIALLTLVLVFFASRPGEAASSLRPGIWYLFFLLAFLVLSNESLRRRSTAWTSASGVALGMAVLFEPYAIVIASVVAIWLLGRGRHGVPMAAGLLIGTALTATCGLVWAGRHGYDPASVLSYQTRLLAQRLAFLSLEPGSWIAALVVPIPLLGDWLALVLPDAMVRKLGAFGPGTLLMEGANVIQPQAFAKAAGEPAGAIAWLLHDRLMANPVAYLASLPPVLARGLWGGGGIVALIGILHVKGMLGFARADWRHDEHVLAMLPALTLLAVNTLVTDNSHWLNPLLPILYAYAFAYVAAGW